MGVGSGGDPQGYQKEPVAAVVMRRLLELCATATSWKMIEGFKGFK